MGSDTLIEEQLVDVVVGIRLVSGLALLTPHFRVRRAVLLSTHFQALLVVQGDFKSIQTLLALSLVSVHSAVLHWCLQGNTPVFESQIKVLLADFADAVSRVERAVLHSACFWHFDALSGVRVHKILLFALQTLTVKIEKGAIFLLHLLTVSSKRSKSASEVADQTGFGG